ncbi:Uncharacterised protein [Vibrio cholerae]|nr:Uncharacterised protein [Vibrio cholerae]CSI49074.1 Uncharacterised protein [Vibrio cholerae]CSI60382.1 Uncharacterised protein [Vibrio cholerae]
MQVHVQRGHWRLIRNVVVTIDTANFFHQILLDSNIKTPCWRGRLPAFCGGLDLHA